MVRPNNEQGIYTLPKEYTPAITQLIAEGQADISHLPPRLRRALGRTAQNTGLFTFKKVSLIEAAGEIRILQTSERTIKVQIEPEPPLETL